MTVFRIEAGQPTEAHIHRLESRIKAANARLGSMPRSPFQSYPVHDATGSRVAYGRCFPCERWLGVENVRRRFVWVQNPIEVPHVREPLEPGWYCEECLRRARQRQ